MQNGQLPPPWAPDTIFPRHLGVIVRYQGDISFLEESGVRITYLLFQYAILLLPEQLMDDVTNLPQITYMEKPKRLSFADFAGRSISVSILCRKVPVVSSETARSLPASDSGVDYTHPAFRNADGSSRLLALWDQTIPAVLRKAIPLEPCTPDSRSTRR